MRWITKNGVHIPIDEYDEIQEAVIEHYSYSKRPTLYLPRDEYAHVMSEINTWYRKDYDRKKIIGKYIGDYIYIFENGGYNEYRFIDKKAIKKDFKSRGNSND